MGVVVLVRHGQASFGADDYDVLSPAGWEQGRLLGEWLGPRAPAPSALVRGTMRRHRETAEAMAAAAGWEVEAEVDSGWDEFDHLAVVAADPDVPSGDLDRRAFQQAFERATARWSSGRFDAEYAEPWSAFRERVLASLAGACDRAGSGRSVVVVSSGGPIAAACAALADPEDADPLAFARRWGRFNTVLVNSSVTRIVVGSTGSRLLTYNEHPHLGADALTYR